MDTDDSMEGDDPPEVKPERLPTGSIEKIVFKDFLTYENALMIAGKNLNVILGVNGSGKSTVICGICLAVGGTPKMLGRSESIGDFVRHGKDMGFVEVFISDETKGTQCFKIQIRRDERSDKSRASYYINGQKTTHDNVVQVVKGYNIQIDNPCTFLAQDKVKSFSEQNPQELLHNTEKAGDPRLYELHQTLIAQRNEHRDLGKEMGVLEKQLQDATNNKDRLEPLVESFQRQQVQDSKINALSKRNKFMEFEEISKSTRKQEGQLKRLIKREAVAATELKEAQTKDTNLQRRLDTIAKQTDPIKKNIYQVDAQLRDLLRVNHYDRQVAVHKRELDAETASYENYEQEIQELKGKVRNLQVALERNRREFEAQRADTDKRRADLADVRTRLQADLHIIEDRMPNLVTAKRRLQYERREMQYNLSNRKSPYEDKLRELQSVDRRGPEWSYAAQAWRYLESNDSGISVNVPFFDIVIQKENAPYLEALVGYRDILMFIFQNREDEQEISRRFPKIHTTVVDPRDIDRSLIQARISSRLQECGFECLAVNLIESAPDVVLQYLCNVAGLGRIPIAKRQFGSGRNLHEDLYQMNISRYIVEKQLSDVKKSKYGNREIIVSSRQLNRDARVFVTHGKAVAAGVDHQWRDFEAKEQRMDAQIAEATEQRNKLKTELTEVLRELSDLTANCNREADIKTQLDHNLQRLRHKEQNKPDVARAQDKFAQAKKATARETLKRVKELIKLVEQRADQRQEETYIDLSVAPISKRKRECYNLYLRKSAAHKELETKRKKKEQAAKAAKEEIQLASDDLQNYCNIPSTSRNGLNNAQKRKFDELIEGFEALDLMNKPKDEIEAMLAAEQAKKNMRAQDGSAEDVKKYAQMSKLQKTLEAQVAANAGDVKARTAVLQKEIEKWKAPVKELVRKINANYTRFFGEIGCVGEVELEVPKEPLDVADYGIMINVSFRRNEKVRRLDHQVQSGGERSVSTMLYLLALQELCPVPFRCVDEINQGMDPVNERKVFEIMINTLTGCGNLAKTQYFLLTPKLLHDLPYNEKVTIQCVANSRALPKDSHGWNPYKMLDVLGG